MADETPSELMVRRVDAAAAFVEIVDALVGDFDVIDMLTVLASRSVELVGAAAAGILLADADETLRVIGSSNEQAHLLELLQVQNAEGPCLDSYRTGKVVSHRDLTSASPWPRFAAASVAQGYPSVCAVPLRLKDSRIGCLNLFMSEAVELPESDVALAQALADVASITIVQDQSTRDSDAQKAQSPMSRSRPATDSCSTPMASPSRDQRRGSRSARLVSRTTSCAPPSRTCRYRKRSDGCPHTSWSSSAPA